MRTKRFARQSAFAGLLPCLLLAAVAAGDAGASTILVAPPGTIADGLAAAAAGDTVLVACGTYQEQGLVLPDGVVLRGEADDPACAVIATMGGAPILSCVGTGAGTRVENLTLAVGDGTYPSPVARAAGSTARTPRSSWRTACSARWPRATAARCTRATPWCSC